MWIYIRIYIYSEISVEFRFEIRCSRSKKAEKVILKPHGCATVYFYTELFYIYIYISSPLLFTQFCKYRAKYRATSTFLFINCKNLFFFITRNKVRIKSTAFRRSKWRFPSQINSYIHLSIYIHGAIVVYNNIDCESR